MSDYDSDSWMEPEPEPLVSVTHYTRPTFRFESDLARNFEHPVDAVRFFGAITNEDSRNVVPYTRESLECILSYATFAARVGCLGCSRIPILLVGPRGWWFIDRARCHTCNNACDCGHTTTEASAHFTEGIRTCCQLRAGIRLDVPCVCRDASRCFASCEACAQPGFTCPVMHCPRLTVACVCRQGRLFYDASLNMCMCVCKLYARLATRALLMGIALHTGSGSLKAGLRETLYDPYLPFFLGTTRIVCRSPFDATPGATPYWMLSSTVFNRRSQRLCGLRNDVESLTTLAARAIPRSQLTRAAGLFAHLSSDHPIVPAIQSGQIFRLVTYQHPTYPSHTPRWTDVDETWFLALSDWELHRRVHGYSRARVWEVGLTAGPVPSWVVADFPQFFDEEMLSAPG